MLGRLGGGGPGGNRDRGAGIRGGVLEVVAAGPGSRIAGSSCRRGRGLDLGTLSPVLPLPQADLDEHVERPCASELQVEHLCIAARRGATALVDVVADLFDFGGIGLRGSGFRCGS